MKSRYEFIFEYLGTPLRNRPDVGSLQRVRQFQVGSDLGNIPESEHDTGKQDFHFINIFASSN